MSWPMGGEGERGIATLSLPELVEIQEGFLRAAAAQDLDPGLRPLETWGIETLWNIEITGWRRGAQKPCGILRPLAGDVGHANPVEYWL